MQEKLRIIQNDPWLEPYEKAIKGRHEYAISKEKELVGERGKSL